MTTVLRLDESGTRTVPLSAEQGRRLAGSGLVAATPSSWPGHWNVAAGLKVGVARVGDIEVRIRPKVPVARLLFLVGYGHHDRGWRHDLVGVDSEDDLGPVVADVYATILERALRRGILQGYESRDETSTVLRGRLREADQLRRHHGRPVPLEIRHDDFTVDIPENRLLLGALRRLLRVPRVPDDTRRRLGGLARRLGDVRPLLRGASPPTWVPTRLNQHLQPALHLARLVWDSASPEMGEGPVPITGFVFDMWSVFERFLTTALRERLAAAHGGHVPRRTQKYLDRDGRLGFYPDFLWSVAGRPAAVVDAKYKRGRPIEDVYQVFAYCTALGLPRGHLVYAVGEPPVRHRIRGSSIEIVTHALDLDAPPAEVLSRVATIAEMIAADRRS